MPVSGDEIRNVRFIRAAGYDASQVKDLLNRIVAELDAGRPAGPLIANAAFRKGVWPHCYHAKGVDWFLEQLWRREDQAELARMNADPWRDLATDIYSMNDFVRGTSFRPFRPGAARRGQEYKDAWRDFSQQPGTRLSWVRTGARHRELRTAEQQTVASLHIGWPTTLSAGGRTFTWKLVPGSSWPGIADTISRDRPGEPAHMLPDAETPGSRERQVPKKDPSLRQLLDETGTPILYGSGVDGGYIKFPGGAVAAVPGPGHQAGKRRHDFGGSGREQRARYRLVSNTPSLWKIVEITVHPDQQLTDELALAFVLSAPWLSSHFDSY